MVHDEAFPFKIASGVSQFWSYQAISFLSPAPAFDRSWNLARSNCHRCSGSCCCAACHTWNAARGICGGAGHHSSNDQRILKWFPYDSHMIPIWFPYDSQILQMIPQIQMPVASMCIRSKKSATLWTLRCLQGERQKWNFSAIFSSYTTWENHRRSNIPNARLPELVIDVAR